MRSRIMKASVVSYQDRKIDKAFFFCLLLGFVLPFVSIGPLAFLSRTMSVNEFIAVITDTVLIIYSVVCFILVPVILYKFYSKKLCLYFNERKR